MVVQEAELVKSRAPTAPLVPIKRSIADRYRSRSPEEAEVVVLIGSLLALGFALSHIGSATQAEAVAWAFVVAAVFAALRKWA